MSDRTGQMKAAENDPVDGATERRGGTTYSSATLTADRPGADESGQTASGQTTVMRPVEPTSPALATRASATAPAPARSRFSEPAPNAEPAPIAEPAPATEPAASDDGQVIGAVGPRPRASALATLALLVGLLGAVAVITGQLAGLGAGLGVIAALLAFGGVAATGSRHVAGKTDAMLGLVLGLASIVFGVIALSGRFGWLNAHTNYISDLHQWLQVHASWMLPS